MPTEQFFNFEQNYPEPKEKITKGKKPEKPPARKKEKLEFSPISEQERQDDQPRYGH